MAAEDRGPLMHAHIGMLRALTGTSSACSIRRAKILIGEARSLRHRHQNYCRGAQPMSQWVKSRRTHYEHMFSALPPNSDIARCSRHVGKVPTAEVAVQQQLAWLQAVDIITSAF